MPDGHRPAVPQVTAVDGQFGTHGGKAGHWETYLAPTHHEH